MNTWFQKKRHHYGTWMHPANKLRHMIDLVMMISSQRLYCMDVEMPLAGLITNWSELSWGLIYLRFSATRKDHCPFQSICSHLLLWGMNTGFSLRRNRRASLMTGWWHLRITGLRSSRVLCQQQRKWLAEGRGSCRSGLKMLLMSCCLYLSLWMRSTLGCLKILPEDSTRITVQF